MAKSMATRSDAYRARVSAWKSGSTVARATGPSNIPRARALGYKAKKEFVIVRVRTPKGRRIRRKAKLGRKSGKNQKRVSPAYSKQWLAEQRAARGHINMRVVGSYFAGKDGTHEYYEVIMCLKQSHKPLVRKVSAPAAKTASAKATK